MAGKETFCLDQPSGVEYRPKPNHLSSLIYKVAHLLKPCESSVGRGLSLSNDILGSDIFIVACLLLPQNHSPNVQQSAGERNLGSCTFGLVKFSA